VSVDVPRQDVWRGRITTGLDPRASALCDSLSVDQRLWPEELLLSRAYAATLAECGIMSAGEADALCAACDRLESDIASGATTLEGEDIHSAVEAELTRLCGDPGRKLHTGRSRNDQVATLLRLRASWRHAKPPIFCRSVRPRSRELLFFMTATRWPRVSASAVWPKTASIPLAIAISRSST
jgi:hypothetical protein